MGSRSYGPCTGRLALVALSASSCGSDAGSNEGTVFRDSAEVRIAESVASRPTWQDPWTLDPEPELRIGSADASGPTQLHRIRDLTFLPNDRIAAIDGQTAEVRIFDLTGEHRLTVGRAGDGPGEFSQPWRVYPGPGDSLLVVDLPRTVSIFDDQGTYARRFTPTGEMGESRQGPPQGMFGDGTLLFAQPVRRDPARTGLGRTQRELVRIDLEGEVLDSFGLFEEQTVRFGEGALSYIFGPRGAVSAADSTFLYGPGSPFEIRFHDRDKQFKGPLRGEDKVGWEFWVGKQPESGRRGRTESAGRCRHATGARGRGWRHGSWSPKDGAMGDGGRPGGRVRECQRKGTKPAGASGIPVMGRRLVELELRDGLGSGEVEGRGLVEVEFGLGRAACGRDPGRPMGQVEVEEDVLHGGGEGDEGDDPHLSAAGRAQEREHLVDAGQELGPEHAAGS